VAKRYKRLLSEFSKISSRKEEINFMEIGTWKGVRAREILLSTSSPVSYYGFDLFEDLTPELKEQEFCGKAMPPPMSHVLSFLNKTGKEIHLFKGDSAVTIPKLIDEDSLPCMDLIFIDGGHSKDTIRNDWENIQPLVGEDTVVVFDDWYKERDDFGCKVTLDGIDSESFEKEVLEDAFDKDKKSGLTIHLAMVKRRSA
jgi:hypothetical protein